MIMWPASVSSGAAIRGIPQIWPPPGHPRAQLLDRSEGVMQDSVVASDNARVSSFVAPYLALPGTPRRGLPANNYRTRHA
jgi:hypothetical protein